MGKSVRVYPYIRCEIHIEITMPDIQNLLTLVDRPSFLIRLLLFLICFFSVCACACVLMGFIFGVKYMCVSDTHLLSV